MRVFDFDGTIYKGESLFDLYLFSVRYEPRVLKYIAPVAQCGIRYKTGHAELQTMERKLGRIIRRYLQDIDASKRVARLCGSNPSPTVPSKRGGDPVAASHAGLNALSEAFWNRKFHKIKAWYQPQPDDVIVTASFDLTVGGGLPSSGHPTPHRLHHRPGDAGDLPPELPHEQGQALP